MKLRPLDDKIVIKKIEKEETTTSGIVLPSSAKEESNIAEVVATGNKLDTDEDMKGLVKVGDKVIFQNMQEMTLNLIRKNTQLLNSKISWQ